MSVTQKGLLNMFVHDRLWNGYKKGCGSQSNKYMFSTCLQDLSDANANAVRCCTTFLVDFVQIHMQLFYC